MRASSRAWHERTHEDQPATHLILSPLAAPSTFRFEPLFEDSFVCVAGRKLQRGKGSITLDEYLGFRHVSIETQPDQRNLINRSLAEAGVRRHVAVHLPYFQAAIGVLGATDLVLTMPARIAEPTLAALDFPKLKAPKEIPRIRYSMVWHPRFDSDLLHSWIRETVCQIFHAPASQQESIAVSRLSSAIHP